MFSGLSLLGMLCFRGLVCSMVFSLNNECLVHRLARQNKSMHHHHLLPVHMLTSVHMCGLQENPDEAFAEWASRHKKVYSSDAERAERAAVWRENLDFIQEYNAKGASHWVCTPCTACMDTYVGRSFPMHVERVSLLIQSIAWLKPAPCQERLSKLDAVAWRPLGHASPISRQTWPLGCSPCACPQQPTPCVTSPPSTPCVSQTTV